MELELAPETAEMIANAGEAADFLKKFTHPSRLMIVCTLVDGERSVRDLEDMLGIRQPGLSQQIAELRDAGFIVGRKESKNVFYRLADGRVSEFIATMHRMFCATSGLNYRDDTIYPHGLTSWQCIGEPRGTVLQTPVRRSDKGGGRKG